MLLIFALLARLPAATIDSCRDRLVAVRELLGPVDPRTWGATEALRAVAHEAPSARVELARFFLGDPVLKQICRDGHCDELIRRLVSPERSHRDAGHVVGRFMIEKGYARKIVRRLEIERFDKASAKAELFKATTMYPINTEYLTVFGRKFTDEAWAFLEDRVYSDPEFQRNPDAYVRKWRESVTFNLIETTPEIAALYTLENFAKRFEGLERFGRASLAAGFRGRADEFVSRRWSPTGPID